MMMKKPLLFCACLCAMLTTSVSAQTHTTHEVTTDELIWPKDFSTYHEQGWMWTGYNGDDGQTSGMPTNACYIDPITDNVLEEPVRYQGITFNRGTSGHVYWRIKGAKAMNTYITCNEGEEKNVILTATPETGDVIEQRSVCTSASLMLQTELDPAQTYDVCITSDQTGRIVLYAIKLLAGDYTGIGRVSASEPATDILYDLQGRRLSTTPAKGIYVQKGKKVVLK